FTGTGLNDFTVSGSYTGSTNATFVFTIDSVGAEDTVAIVVDGQPYDSGVLLSNISSDFANGLTFGFLTLTGHTLGDFWSVSSTVHAPVTLKTPSGASFGEFQPELFYFSGGILGLRDAVD